MFELLVLQFNRLFMLDIFCKNYRILDYLIFQKKFAGAVSHKCQHFVMGQQTWFSGVREAFLSGDHEPWVFRGKK
jgi:hypothetical protein